MLRYTITNDTVTVVVDGQVITTRAGEPNYEPLRRAVLAGDEQGVHRHRSVALAVADWARDHFTVRGGCVYHGQDRLPDGLNARILAMAQEGSSPEALLRFWERLRLNPSMRSVEQLFGFLQHQGIPIEPDGHFLAYKGVRHDLRDCHTGTFDNTPGQTHEMPRNKISDDPNSACSYGFHVGSLEYAAGFGARVVICRVDPRDVVCVPYDSSQQKVRTCRYVVVGFHGAPLASTVTSSNDVPYENQDDPDEMTHDDEVCDAGKCDTCIDDGDVVGFVAPRPVKKTPRRLRPFKRIHGLDREGLWEETLDDLRPYASQGLQIVGAWRLSKSDLIDLILRQRNYDAR